MSNEQLPIRTPPPGGAHPIRHVVLVTGASSGIGRATALQLLRRGDTHVVLVARRRAELEETVRRAGTSDAARTSIIVCDLATADGARALARQVRAEHPRLTALVNNAGVSASLDVFDPAAGSDTERVLALNLLAPMLLVHELVDLLAASRGAIVNVSSAAGLIGTPKSPVYSASKWGLTGFSEALHARCGPLGIRVTNVQPGPVPTEGWPHDSLRRSPLRKLLTADVGDIAAAIERAACAPGRGRAGVVLPRIYGLIPFVRGVAPALLRAVVGGVGRRATAAQSQNTPAARAGRDPR
ncbi:MAG: SDR family NAD(P)-dependent oxidoreductase [Thermoleophilia bacterium]|nr:SDR family NAD(P)-dependent oxidoreductase [Thermoleophilia bacterium]